MNNTPLDIQPHNYCYPLENNPINIFHTHHFLLLYNQSNIHGILCIHSSPLYGSNFQSMYHSYKIPYQSMSRNSHDMLNNVDLIHPLYQDKILEDIPIDMMKAITREMVNYIWCNFSCLVQNILCIVYHIINIIVILHLMHPDSTNQYCRLHILKVPSLYILYNFPWDKSLWCIIILIKNHQTNHMLP